LIATRLAAFLWLASGGAIGDDLLTVTSRTLLHRSLLHGEEYSHRCEIAHYLVETLNQKWLDWYPENPSAQGDFAEKHFTTSRFAECEKRIDMLLANPTVEAPVNIALRAIKIANLLALNKIDLVPNNMDTLLGIIADQREDFKVRWAFEGGKYFISHSETLALYRPWLLQFFNAAEGEDRQAILTALRQARANVQAILRE
jgi:hypothetical protein